MRMIVENPLISCSSKSSHKLAGFSARTNYNRDRSDLRRKMDMSDQFCSHCGNRLTGTEKFCPYCGEPAGAKSGAKDSARALDAQIFERLASKVRLPSHP